MAGKRKTRERKITQKVDRVRKEPEEKELSLEETLEETLEESLGKIVGNFFSVPVRSFGDSLFEVCQQKGMIDKDDNKRAFLSKADEVEDMMHVELCHAIRKIRDSIWSEVECKMNKFNNTITRELSCIEEEHLSKIRKFSEEKKIELISQCGSCMEEMVNSRITSLACGHLICHSCIFRLMTEERKIKCPLCRTWNTFNRSGGRSDEQQEQAEESGEAEEQAEQNQVSNRMTNYEQRLLELLQSLSSQRLPVQ